jgi:hypothetical protein
MHSTTHETSNAEDRASMPGNDGMRQPEHPSGDRAAQLHPGRTASDELERWRESDGEKPLGSII